MESPEIIAAWRDRVARAKSEWESAEDKRQAAVAHYEWTRGFTAKRDSSGRLFQNNLGREIIEYNATDDERRWANEDARKAELAAREARERLAALRKELANAEKPDPLPIEQVERQLNELVPQDGSLYAQLEDQIRALQAMIGEWNAHVEAKLALRAELRQRTGAGQDAGMLGKVDARWNVWLTADFRDDAALHRQFALMAHGKGYMNPLPTPARRALEDIRADAQRVG